MKKLILFFGLLLCLHGSILAKKSSVLMDYHTKHNTSTTSVERSLGNCPIDVYYDDEINSLFFEYYEPIDATVYICDSNGSIIYQGPISIVGIPIQSKNCIYNILIESDKWYAVGSIFI